MKHIYIFLQVIIICSLILPFHSCSSTKKSVSPDQNIVLVKPDSLWIANSLGCLNYRENTFRKIEQDFDKYKGLSFEDILIIFGIPDETSARANSLVVYTYYINNSNQCDYYKNGNQPISKKIIEPEGGWEIIFEKGIVCCQSQVYY